ncbi:RNA polymerase alpha subunit C-terminal domain-containing protein [Sporosarcina sp. D27]|uniref:RNA polymerase alpha subunit C-terminal domain-containing protein n=1 Tax=Sporosarcina sp. D27 TaxID=1382305 RepID=UPI00046FB05C|nr:RNA polymerase alpha subunit C-terminal domain-containing protein [Sporosarcina sp. D27]
MNKSPGDLRTCDKGHRYYKKSDCPTCPKCEKERKPESGFLSQLSAPARRALEINGIHSLEILASFSEKKLLKLHGVGPASIPKLKAALKEQGMSLKQ